MVGHALTVIGYDDEIGVDLNNDGEITNDIDINGDDVVDMGDWEMGALILAVLFLQRVLGTSIAGRPLLLLGVLLLTLGLQMFGLGLVGEIIVHLQAPNRRSYRIVREETGVDG